MRAAGPTRHLAAGHTATAAGVVWACVVDARTTAVSSVNAVQRIRKQRRHFLLSFIRDPTCVSMLEKGELLSAADVYVYCVGNSHESSYNVSDYVQTHAFTSHVYLQSPKGASEVDSGDTTPVCDRETVRVDVVVRNNMQNRPCNAETWMTVAWVAGIKHEHGSAQVVQATETHIDAQFH